jgi:hypothetical protein
MLELEIQQNSSNSKLKNNIKLSAHIFKILKKFSIQNTKKIKILCSRFRRQMAVVDEPEGEF